MESGSSASIVTRLQAGRPRNRDKIFGKGGTPPCTPKRPDGSLGAVDIFERVMVPGREADNSNFCCVQIKNLWSCTYLPHMSN
jgi:hypothetical protein